MPHDVTVPGARRPDRQSQARYSASARPLPTATLQAPVVFVARIVFAAIAAVGAITFVALAPRAVLLALVMVLVVGLMVAGLLVALTVPRVGRCARGSGRRAIQPDEVAGTGAQRSPGAGDCGRPDQSPLPPFSLAAER